MNEAVIEYDALSVRFSENEAQMHVRELQSKALMSTVTTRIQISNPQHFMTSSPG